MKMQDLNRLDGPQCDICGARQPHHHNEPIAKVTEAKNADDIPRGELHELLSAKDAEIEALKAEIKVILLDNREKGDLWLDEKAKHQVTVKELENVKKAYGIQEDFYTKELKTEREKWEKLGLKILGAIGRGVQNDSFTGSLRVVNEWMVEIEKDIKSV